MKKELLEALKAQIRKDTVKFLMPGHKGHFEDIERVDTRYDFTESFETDNLNNPKGVIRRSQIRAANVFGSRATFYTVNGSSGALMASIYYATKPGDNILVSRNCHISVIRAAIVRRLNIHYIKTEFKDGYDRNIQYGEFKRQFDLVRPKAVVITHPNYFGFPVEIERIASEIGKSEAILIVDEAHGAHLSFDNRLPSSALKAGADIVVQSVHKMLTGLNQSAFIHIASKRVDQDKLFRAITTFQTTSPSYPIILSCELAAEFMQNEGKRRLRANIDYAMELSDKLSKIKDVNVLDYKGRDPLKIVFNINGITGEDLHRQLFDKYKIECEMNDGLNVLMLASLMNKSEDYEMAYKAIKEIAESSEGELKERYSYFILPEKRLEAYEAYDLEYEKIPKSQALNRISAEFIAPYPPGVAVLVPGEIISNEALDYLNEEVYVIKERRQ